MTIREDAKKIMQASLASALPDNAVHKALSSLPEVTGKLVLVAIGKAAWQMSKAAVDYLGDRISDGVCITKYDHVLGDIPHVRCYEAGHPVLDENSINATKEAELLTDDEWNKTVDVDLTGTFKMSREVARVAMIPQEYGRIINTASMFGLVGTMATPTSPYAAAKGGVVNLTRQLAAEWAKYNITVNAICPGTFPTELTIDLLETEEYKAYTKTVVPVGRSGVDGELDSTVVYLASPKSGYVTGQSIAVDGGYTCI